MALLISDFEVDYDQDDNPMGPGERLEVSALADTKPLYVSSNSVWMLDQLGKRVAVPEYVSGSWSLVLPAPSECQPDTVKWTITRGDGAAYYGAVPENVAGPVTILDLLNLYGWGLVESSTTPVTAIQGPNPFDPVTTSPFAPPAGGADALPGNPAGWAQIVVNGMPQWVPFW